MVDRIGSQMFSFVSFALILYSEKQLKSLITFINYPKELSSCMIVNIINNKGGVDTPAMCI